MLKTIVQGISSIPADDLALIPSNTNLIEGLHHTTNLNTGIKQPPVEAIET